VSTANVFAMLVGRVTNVKKVYVPQNVPRREESAMAMPMVKQYANVRKVLLGLTVKQKFAAINAVTTDNASITSVNAIMPGQE